MSHDKHPNIRFESSEYLPTEFYIRKYRWVTSKTPNEKTTEEYINEMKKSIELLCLVAKLGTPSNVQDNAITNTIYEELKIADISSIQKLLEVLKSSRL